MWHVPDKKPSSFGFSSLGSYHRPALCHLCQRNPLPIQIPFTYSHHRELIDIADIIPDLTCKRGSVGQSEGQLIPRSSVWFRLKHENSNSHGFELHRPSIKGTKLLLKEIKAMIIIIRNSLLLLEALFGHMSQVTDTRQNHPHMHLIWTSRDPGCDHWHHTPG